MKTKVGGMLKLTNGWWIAAASSPVPGKVRLILEHDPGGQLKISAAGVDVLDLTELEARELEEVLHEARTGHRLSRRCDRV